jgi:hypothetical protein
MHAAKNGELTEEESSSKEFTSVGTQERVMIFIDGARVN